MHHIGTLRIETERLILRRFTLEDDEQMYNGWASDERVSRYMRWKTHGALMETHAVVEGWVAQYAEPTNYHWAIEIKDTSELIGSIGLFLRGENDACFEAGYNIAYAHWGKGYTAEALNAVIDFIFDRVGANRVEAYHSVNNPASGRVMQKCGMAYEGRSRQKYRIPSGSFEDCYSYAVLYKDRHQNTNII